ncbi:MAG TPA: hypothetical protein VMJ32_14605 [Pirellulales bacterium]|nr:hypothetical protein [Pirellulales bacterium]
MQPTKELADELFREKIRNAREMNPADKLLAGPRWFDEGCRNLQSKLQCAFPQASDVEVHTMLDEFIKIMKRRDWI